MKKEINPTELEFLLRFPVVMNHTSPVDFLSNLCWGGIKVGGFITRYPSHFYVLVSLIYNFDKTFWWITDRMAS